MSDIRKLLHECETLALFCRGISNTSNVSFRQLDQKRNEIVALASQWVSVEERLPEKGKTQLFCCCTENDCHEPFTAEWAGVFSGYKNTLVVNWGYDDDEYTATHWMPLPSLPIIKEST